MTTLIPTFKVDETECKRHATDVVDKFSGCAVVEVVISSRGKYKLTPVFYADRGDPATTTNIDKVASIGDKSNKKSH